MDKQINVDKQVEEFLQDNHYILSEVYRNGNLITIDDRKDLDIKPDYVSGTSGVTKKDEKSGVTPALIESTLTKFLGNIDVSLIMGNKHDKAKFFLTAEEDKDISNYAKAGVLASIDNNKIRVFGIRTDPRDTKGDFTIVDDKGRGIIYNVYGVEDIKVYYTKPFGLPLETNDGSLGAFTIGSFFYTELKENNKVHIDAYVPDVEKFNTFLNN